MTVEAPPTWRVKEHAVHVAWWRNNPDALEALSKRDREFVELIAGLNGNTRHSYAEVSRRFGLRSRQVKDHFLLLATRSTRTTKE